MKIRLASPLQYDSIVDGEGMRAVLWTQGCPHNCLGCHNPKTHDFDGGLVSDTDTIIEELKESIKYQEGITLSGGDPFMQAKAVLEIAKYVKSINKSVWAYTGFTFEELLNMSITNNSIIDLLNNIDVLVDGKFILEEKSLDLYYKGSSNQRVIDVPKSLKNHKIILVKKYMNKKNYVVDKVKKDHIYF